jgi:hypothetical protein
MTVGVYNGMVTDCCDGMSYGLPIQTSFLASSTEPRFTATQPATQSLVFTVKVLVLPDDDPAVKPLLHVQV